MASAKQKNRTKKSRITIPTPEEIALRRLHIEAEKREAAKNPENWGPREEVCEPQNIVRFGRQNAERAKAAERIKISFQALYECGSIRIHHAVAGNRCLEICQRMTGEIETPDRPMERNSGGLRNYEPTSHDMMTAQLEWKRLSSAIGTIPSNIILRICMAWIQGVQIDWKYVVRTEYHLPVDENTTRETRYLSAMLVGSLEGAHQHFFIP